MAQKQKIDPYKSHLENKDRWIGRKDGSFNSRSRIIGGKGERGGGGEKTKDTNGPKALLNSAGQDSLSSYPGQ